MSTLDVPIPAGHLVVSCQALPGTPMRNPQIMAAMAASAIAAGAVGVRINGPADVNAVRRIVDAPIIGINKVGDRDGVYITPTFASAQEVVQAGAAMVALDATDRPRPGGATLRELVARIHDELGVPVMADCDSLATAQFAADAGCDVLASTMSGYLGGRPGPGPDLEFISEMTAEFAQPVIGEGRYTEPAHVREAFQRGAHALVIGTAITSPGRLTEKFVAATPAAQPAATR